MSSATFLIIGGGIAGVSCAETLAYLCPNKSIILLTQSPLIKAVTNLVCLGKCITTFDVEEKHAKDVFSSKSLVNIVNDKLHYVCTQSRYVLCASGLKINFEYICICTGARPKIIPQAVGHERVLTIRDTESVKDFQKLLNNARKIVIAGNGGIATELAYELKGIEIDWVIKDKHITATFVDPGAAQFFQSKLNDKSFNESENNAVVKRMRYYEDGESSSSGAALGPDWHNLLNLTPSNPLPGTVTVHFETEISQIENSKDEWPCYVILNNNKKIGCDIIVSATGVIPQMSFDWDETPELGIDGGISVNELMETSLMNVYAAGDVCSANWNSSDHWFQMRLWSQARQMGAQAAKSMVAKMNHESILPDFCFEMFSHVTKLFGYKVVLLGKYNGQGLGNNYEAIVRVTKDVEYIKLVLSNGKLQGAVMIGEVGLEETFENLILNQLDISMYGEDILNPDIDIEDYFD